MSKFLSYDRTYKHTDQDYYLIYGLLLQDDAPLPEDDENKEKRTDDISSWDAEFLKVRILILKSDYLKKGKEKRGHVRFTAVLLKSFSDQQ